MMVGQQGRVLFSNDLGASDVSRLVCRLGA
jgi:hypothetical protein